MTERFAPHFGAHYSGIAGPVIFGWLAHRMASPGSSLLDTVIRFGLATFLAAVALAIAVHYLYSGINRYDVTPDGLVIRRLWASRLIPWSHLRRMDWNRWDLVVLRGPSSVITYTNHVAFPRFEEFLRILHQRSACTLSPNLEWLLYSDAEPD